MVALSATTIAFSASFDCTHTIFYAEKYICTDAVASKLDEDISILYRNLLISDGNGVKKTQLHWLALRNACSDITCINKLLNDRRTELLAGADNYVSYLGVSSQIAHNIVIGMQQEKIIFIRYLSINKRNEDCNFVMKKQGDALVSEEGEKLPLTINGKETIVNFELLSSSSNADFMCAVGAKLPKLMKIRDHQLFMEY
jgi:uncharacterized protein